jgi:hypothetical protein
MKGKGRKGKERKEKKRKGKPCRKSHKSVIFHVVMGLNPCGDLNQI